MTKQQNKPILVKHIYFSMEKVNEIFTSRTQMLCAIEVKKVEPTSSICCEIL